MPKKIRPLGHQATQNPEYPKNVGNDEGVSPRKMGECTRKPRRGDRADTDAVCVAPPGLDWRCSLASWGSRPRHYPHFLALSRSSRPFFTMKAGKIHWNSVAVGGNAIR